MNRVIPSITGDDTIGRIVERLCKGGGVLGVSGLWGSAAPMVSSALFELVNRPVLYITSHLDEADEVLDDLETFSGGHVDLLPAWETLPGEGSASGEIHGERLRFCAMLREQRPGMLVAPIQALLQPVPTPQALDRDMLHLAIDRRHDPDELIHWLVDRGFERLDRVESPGDFARRGDIVDIYPPGRETGIRLEFLDDCLEAIRTFDISTQRSTGRETSLTVAAMPGHQRLHTGDATPLFGYLPDDTLMVLDRPDDVQEMAQTFWNRLERSDLLIEPRALFRQMGSYTQLHITRFGASVGAPGDVFQFPVRSLARFEGKRDEAVHELCSAADDHSVMVYCGNEGERTRLEEMVVAYRGGVPATLELRLGIVHHGFEWMPERTIVVGHHEIFHRSAGRRLRRTPASRPIDSALDLTPGDIVVHVVHGIARFTAMKTMRKGDSNKSGEFLTLEFADKGVLHVPTSQIDLVQKYLGAGGVKPTLSKLGGTRWKRTKEKVSDAVSELAQSLLRTQVARRQHPGVSYPADTTWQREFEESFMYEDTEDQIVVSQEIKTDLTRPRPMDRLICGDVGYGKTELAIRAAFKVVEYGKQVAVLVPTTVLAEQHYRTFNERLAEYPFNIGCLSRFRSPAEQKEIVERAKKGRIDIVIGTHRLLSRDVGFADLGLVIIDEEQRFGVEHKERLKQMRETVDVLTLSATPIPRTLHMSLVGLRDISSLQSPPMDRRSIATRVTRFDSAMIRQAIIRELNRDGQIYFIHNQVRSIRAMAQRLERLVPEARVIFGHGQMKEGQLEKVMSAFLNRRADLLVATTIIESGIDIPSVNTIFINHADRFGLADLHQLRGRVGRSAKRGYCYFLLPPDRPVTPKAAKRLKAIEEFSDLGAGFRIAMRDLEIRGAGNLLGAAQSGHIAAVGYELYCQMLERAVHRSQGKPAVSLAPVHLELDCAAYIPKSYISSQRSRIDIYRRIVSATTVGDVEQLSRDLRDAFGKVPAPLERLLELAQIRALAAAWHIRSIILHRPDLVFAVDSLKTVEALFTDAPGSVRTPDPQTVHLRLSPGHLEPPTLIATLRRMLSKSITTGGLTPWATIA